MAFASGPSGLQGPRASPAQRLPGTHPRFLLAFLGLASFSARSRASSGWKWDLEHGSGHRLKRGFVSVGFPAWSFLPSAAPLIIYMCSEIIHSVANVTPPPTSKWRMTPVLREGQEQEELLPPPEEASEVASAVEAGAVEEVGAVVGAVVAGLEAKLRTKK